MPRKPTATEEMVINTHRNTSPDTSELSAEQKLDLIVTYLHRMDRRDHWRTIGGFLRGLLTLVPILIFLLSAWYFYAHGTEFLQQLTDMSIKSMTNQESLMDRLNNYIVPKK